MNNLNPKDMEIISAVIYTFIAFVLMIIAVLFFVYYSRKKIIQKELEKKDLEIDYQKKLLQATILTQEKERERIAQDLHDDISSKLNIITLNSHLLTSADLSSAEIQEITGNIITTTGVVLESSRTIAHNLLPPILDKFGLHAAIDELCQQSSSGPIQIEYSNDAKQRTFDTIPVEQHLHIFRILQELINNSLRHGKATRIIIVFTKDNNGCYCSYTDNGSGFDTKNTKKLAGLGMKNIESRVAMLEGKLRIESEINKGIHVTINF
ncbi:sensor histidine kinase [Flavobacterium supellecticarium]|uniref:histidine kinase n=1 Tax=Flavobacterium supellecticarium TaxID=2565924 RepID=A0A4S3ZVF7_9FLAO|nr:ATP-binding protein [Flavobacterium supellecticarium]THF49786.1 sensor histidine kinase [Flavobacterium supellecticarium]